MSQIVAVSMEAICAEAVKAARDVLVRHGIERQAKEAVQVAAMAMRYLLDLVPADVLALLLPPGPLPHSASSAVGTSPSNPEGGGG